MSKNFAQKSATSKRANASKEVAVSPEQRKRAEQLSKRSGIPFRQAVLVVTGQKTLNQVLKELYAREKRLALIREGLHPGLVEHVVSGRLTLEKARALTELRALQKTSFRAQRIEKMVNRQPLGFYVFGRGLVGGVVSKVSRYDVYAKPLEPGEPFQLKKHDIKFYCLTSVAADALMLVGRNSEVAALGLGASQDLADRFRPSVEMALEWVKSGRRMLFIMRDGDTISGIPRRVGFFEIDLELAPNVLVTLLTHALYKPKAYVREDQ